MHLWLIRMMYCLIYYLNLSSGLDVGVGVEYNALTNQSKIGKLDGGYLHPFA